MIEEGFNISITIRPSLESFIGIKGESLQYLRKKRKIINEIDFKELFFELLRNIKLIIIVLVLV